MSKYKFVDEAGIKVFWMLVKQYIDGKINEKEFPGWLTSLPNDVPANYVLAGPESGENSSPTFRKLVEADIPIDGITEDELDNMCV